jgi:hypothetical protein
MPLKWMIKSINQSDGSACGATAKVGLFTLTFTFFRLVFFSIKNLKSTHFLDRRFCIVPRGLSSNTQNWFFFVFQPSTVRIRSTYRKSSGCTNKNTLSSFLLSKRRNQAVCHSRNIPKPPPWILSAPSSPSIKLATSLGGCKCQ